MIETITTEEIKINITVFTDDDRFTGKLTPKDIVILENGRLQKAASIRDVPANVLLVLDVGNEIPYAKSNKLTVQTARNLISTLQDNNQFAVMRYAEKAEMLSGWTRDKNQAIESIKTTGLGFGYFSLFNDAMQNVVEFFNKTPLENKHLVLITDGIDAFSDGLAKDFAARNLLTAGLNVHVISYTGLQKQAIGLSANRKQRGSVGVSINLDRAHKRKHKRQANRIQKSEQFLTTLAKDGNGEIFLPDTSEQMVKAAAVLAKNIDAQYVVTYTPVRSPEGIQKDETRIIKVSSRRSDIVIEGGRKLIAGCQKKHCGIEMQ